MVSGQAAITSWNHGRKRNSLSNGHEFQPVGPRLFRTIRAQFLKSTANQQQGNQNGFEDYTDYGQREEIDDQRPRNDYLYIAR